MNAPTLTPFLPARINTGPWVAGYSLDELKRRSAGGQRFVLPICPLGTAPEELAVDDALLLPPLYHEALDGDLKAALLAQMRRCFPFYEGTRARAAGANSFEVRELPATRRAPPVSSPRILAFSVDTAVEQHGPHLPLATDTVQSYGVLHRLAREIEGLVLGPPVDYGQLTWGLPFGFSIDITAPLLTRYVTNFVNAVGEWMAPSAIYSVDVHGSLVHRNAIQDGLRRSRASHWAFRWLYDPLGDVTSARGDQHAGGVETAMVEYISHDLVDARWWQGRIDELAAGQMEMSRAVELSSDLTQFIRETESRPLNGIVGEVRNYFNVDAGEMIGRIMELAREDVRKLL